MARPRPGIQFEETMRGPFALGVTDPEVGRRAGEEAGSDLALHADVRIDDVEAFAEDPDHEGTLSGSVEFAPFGGECPGSEGVFRLFSPGEEANTKWMVYELGFRHEDRPYYLAGRKEVRDDPGFDLWSDTTTLYTRLHEGPDASGPIAGAGMLTLGVDDLVDLVSTMRAIGAESAEEKMTAAATFGRLFLGELWDSYAGHLSIDASDT